METPQEQSSSGNAAAPLTIPAATTTLARWLGTVVVLDTAGPLIYIGTLKEVFPDALILEEVDVHDCSDSRSTKEFYIAQARQLGVHVNRSVVWVRRDFVVSASLLQSVRV